MHSLNSLINMVLYDIDASVNRALAAQVNGEYKRKQEGLEQARWEDDGGRVHSRVLICMGCGATEDDPRCYCNM